MTTIDEITLSFGAKVHGAALEVAPVNLGFEYTDFSAPGRARVTSG
jgi:hypothetical protein